MTLLNRIAQTSFLRTVALMVLALALSATAALADTLMMPKRDALKGTPFIVWGVTTLPNTTTTYSIDFDDGNPPLTGTVTDRSYIAVSKNYTVSGNKTITMTLVNGATTETATVAVQVFDSALISADDLRGVKINMAIEDGLRNLWVNQSARTTFDTTVATNWGRNSWTALVVLAFENHGYQLPNNNTVPAGLYERYLVRRGLNALMQGFASLTLNNQPAGNPCAGAAPAAEFAATSTCIGYYSGTGAGNEGFGNAGYANALMILPFAGSGAFNRTNFEAGGVSGGKSYGEITQRLVDAMAWGQNDPASGNARGGWNYGFNQSQLDGSTAGWNILAILDAEAAGVPLPTFLKPEFTGGINRALNNDGSFDYNADNNPASTPGYPTHRNVTRMGITLQGLFFNGITGPFGAGSIGANAVTNIGNRWGGLNTAGDNYFDTCGSNKQNKGCAYAMFNIFKGLKLANIVTLPGVAASGGRADNDWYKDYQDWLVANQTAPNTVGGGHWATMSFSCCETNAAAHSAIAELILSPVALVLPDEDKFSTVGLSPLTATALEGGTHTVTAKAESTGGTPVPGATVVFTILSGPNAGFTGTDVTDAAGEATYTYTDGGPVGTFGTDKIRASIGTLNSNTVDMIWTPLNRAPVATDNAYTTPEDTAVSGNVITDGTPDSDADGDTMTAALVSGTSNGTVTLNTDGSFTYTPNANYCGTDSFTYDLSDGEESSNVATVTITVTCVNDPPNANDDSNTTTEETAVSGSVAGNDTDVEGDTLTFALASGPSNGTATVNGDGSYTYTPNADFCGTDSFTYTASDASASDTATVTIAVTCVNDPPVANDNAHTTPEDTPVSGAATSSDVDGGAPTYALVTGPSNGTLAFNASGAYTYSPNLNYNGPDSFTFSVSDGNGGTDTGQVTINVTPVNDAPVCTAAAPSVSFIWPPNHQLVNVSVNGVTDPVEGSAITITVTSIWQDEPTNTIGDGNTLIDGYGVGTATAQVRAERSGSKRVPGNGRMYHIYFTGTDAEGGTCTGTVRVAVPHDMGEEHTVGDGGPLYKSTGS